MQVDVAIVGAGAGGIAVASSLQKQNPKLKIAVFDPSEVHYYQPGWTLVGAGIIPQSRCARPMASVIPRNVDWVPKAVESFQPTDDAITLADGSSVKYRALVVAPGLKLDFDAIPGLSETLGQNGVSCNYVYQLTPYTWECIQNLKSGTAIFTQPPMPIKCPGAPQKILYLAADYWRQLGLLSNISIQFRTAGPSLFGVADFVPQLTQYMQRYGARVHTTSNLIRVDGPNKLATFRTTTADGQVTVHEEKFDFLHAVPPQAAPDFLKVRILSLCWPHTETRFPVLSLHAEKSSGGCCRLRQRR
jgi:sulfide:quinone oxidoreductase